MHTYIKTQQKIILILSFNSKRILNQRNSPIKIMKNTKRKTGKRIKIKHQSHDYLLARVKLIFHFLQNLFNKRPK